MVALANSGRISQSSAVSQSTNHRACCFISSSSTTWDRAKWNLRSSKKQRSSCSLSGLNCGNPWSPHVGMWGTTGCDIVVISWVIVGKIVRKLGRVGDGNGDDGNDGSVSNGVISEVAWMGFRSACGLCMVSVVLYKRDGIGCDMSDPSEIERAFQIPSLRS